MALYYNDAQVSEPSAVGEDGFFELSYDTADRLVPAGEEIGLEVRYVGTPDQADGTETVTVSLAKATLTPTGITVADAGRAYDGATSLPEGAEVDVSFDGVVSDDNVSLVADDAAYAAPDAGTKAVSATSFSLAKDGYDWSPWYAVANPASPLTADDAEGISQAELTLSWDNYEGRAYADGKGNVTCDVTGAVEADVESGAVAWEVTGADAESAAGAHTATFTLTKNEPENYRLANPEDATLDYTVTKATQFSGTVSIEGWVFGAEASEPVASVTGGDYAELAIAYKPAGAPDDAYVADAPTATGSYTVRAIWTATGNCEAVTATCDFEIARSATDLPAGTTVTNGDGTETSDFTYGEKIVVTVTPAATGEPAENGTATLAAAGPDQMTLWYRPADGEDVLLAGPVDAGADGAYVLTYDTADKLVPTGSATLVARYEGTPDMASAEHEVEVTIAPRRLTASVAAGDSGEISKTYDGTTTAPEGVALKLDGVLEGDAVEATAEAIAFDDKNVDSASEVVATGVALTGDDAGFYAVNDTASASAEITPVTVTVAAGTVEVAYGSGALPEIPLSYEGFVNGETVEGLASSGELTGLDTVAARCDALGAETSAGTEMEAAVDLGELRARNYVFETASGTVTVVKAVPAVAADDPALMQSLDAGATAADLAAPAVLGVDGEPLEGVLTWYADEAMEEPLDADAALAAGEATLWWRFEPEDGNYEPLVGSVTVTVASPEPEPEPAPEPEPQPQPEPESAPEIPATGDPATAAPALLAAGALVACGAAVLRRRMK